MPLTKAISTGAHFSDLAHARRLIEQGGRFIPFSSDLRFIQNGIRDSLASLTQGPEGTPRVVI